MTAAILAVLVVAVVGWDAFLKECRRAAEERVRFEHEVDYLTSRIEFLAARTKAVTRQLSQVFGGDAHREGDRVN